MQRSSRDPSVLAEPLEAWLSDRLGSPATVSNLASTSATGMSSETLLFDALSTDGPRRFVARLAPDPADVPVFGSYDMERQYRVLLEIGARTKVPVPRVYWCEPDPAVLGTPFFVMEWVDGELPPDVMPYNFGESWLFDASASDQRRLQDASVDILVELHRVDDGVEFLELPEPGASPLARHLAHTRAWYDWIDVRSPLVDRVFAWLHDHMPVETPPVLCWGDARIGNVIYRDYTPVAVLDWEMACVGPRELDVGWMIYSHQVFEDLAASYDLPGMPDFMRRSDVVARYESGAGHTLCDLDFYIVYAAVQWAIVFLRTGHRAVHFGEREMPADPDELLYNREPLERMVS